MEFLKELFSWIFSTPFISLSIVFAVILFIFTFRLTFHLFRVLETLGVNLNKKQKRHWILLLESISSIAFLFLVFGILLSKIY